MGFDQPVHWVILAVLAALLFGGYKRLPEMARSAGRSMRVFKTELKGLEDDDAARASASTPAPAAATPFPAVPAAPVPAAPAPAAPVDSAVTTIPPTPVPSVPVQSAPVPSVPVQSAPVPVLPGQPGYAQAGPLPTVGVPAAGQSYADPSAPPQA